MSSLFRKRTIENSGRRCLAIYPATALLLLAACLSALAAAAPQKEALRVCSDPNNLPFSNYAGEGMENRIARLLAEDWGAELEYYWWAQRRGFIRNTLKERRCDVVMGVPSSFEIALTTRPYYRSTYVFVERSADGKIKSFDDPRLRSMRVGVQMIGDDFANTPPAHALASRGVIQNIVGFSVYGDYRRPHPASDIITAVEDGRIDVAVAWGPLAGYFSENANPPLTLTPVSPQFDLPFLPFVFDISMAVRREDALLKERLDEFIVRRRADIELILAEFNVPQVKLPNESGG